MKMYLLTLTVILGCKSISSGDMKQVETVVFDEIHHSKTAVDFKTFEVLNSQEAIDKLYMTIMDQSKAVRHSPIPVYDPKVCLVAITSGLTKSNDISITSVDKSKDKLQIHYKENNSADYQDSDRRNSLIVLKMSEACDFKNILIKNN